MTFQNLHIVHHLIAWLILQAGDMAAEYAVKLAMLHEESAARVEGDLRKRQERHAMLADLQSQAQVSFSGSDADSTLLW